MPFTPTLGNPPLQEILYRESGDPWRVAVACMLLNRTSRVQVDGVWPGLFARFPVSGALAYRSEDGELERLLRPLGLSNRRAVSLRRMSHAWTVDPDGWRSGLVLGYPGLGGYAQDAHDVFVLGRLAVWPDDRVLRAWVELLRAAPAASRPHRYRPTPALAAAGG